MIIDTTSVGAFDVAKTYINNQKITGISIDMTLKRRIDGMNDPGKTTREIIQYLNEQTFYRCCFKTELKCDKSYEQIYVKCVPKSKILNL